MMTEEASISWPINSFPAVRSLQTLACKYDFRFSLSQGRNASRDHDGGHSIYIRFTVGTNTRMTFFLAY